jgi:hypothetical protein
LLRDADQVQSAMRGRSESCGALAEHLLRVCREPHLDKLARARWTRRSSAQLPAAQPLKPFDEPIAANVQDRWSNT